MNPEIIKAKREMGNYNENMYMPIIKDHFGNLIKTEFRYATIDFYGVDYMLELKSRCYSSTDFKDTMIGCNKIEKAIETLERYPNYKVYFAFAFTDGLFVWEYNSVFYEENGGDTQRRINYNKENYYIFVKNLIKISDKPVWIHPKLIKEKTLKKTYKSSIPDGVCFLTFKKG
jgi:hypothetical protein